MLSVSARADVYPRSLLASVKVQQFAPYRVTTAARYFIAAFLFRSMALLPSVRPTIFLSAPFLSRLSLKFVILRAVLIERRT